MDENQSMLEAVLNKRQKKQNTNDKDLTANNDLVVPTVKITMPQAKKTKTR